MSFSAYRAFIDPLLKHLRESVPLFAAMQKGDRVLDVCCGTGAQSFIYTAAGMVATGIDLDPTMIATANEQKKKLGFDSVAFQVADSTALPFVKASFDCASISLALHEKNAEFQHRTIREMKRVVKRSGHLILIDYNVPTPSNIYGFFVCSIERFAGGEHYANYRSFKKNNGLPELLTQHRLEEKRRRITQNGVILMVETDNS